MHTDVREYISLCRVKRGNISEAELARRTCQTTLWHISVK